jgi:outer membrane receptor protein involved in Fe transport
MNMIVEAKKIFMFEHPKNRIIKYRFLKLLVLCCCFFMIIPSYSQNNVRGIVTNQDNKMLDYFTATLRNPVDSTLLVGGSFVDGFFELDLQKSRKCLLTVSFTGYQEYSRLIDFTREDSIQLDTIKLKPVRIEEVVVKGKRPVYKEKDGRYIMNVQSTSLSKLGTGYDVLQRAPGVLVNHNKNIRVFGRGKPTIFINGREIQSKNKLETLSSEKIKQVEVIRNPSAQYGANVTAVIKIKTRKTGRDLLNLEIKNKSRLSKRYSNISGIRINNRAGKFRNYLSYQFEESNSEDSVNSYLNNYRADYIQTMESTGSNNTTDHTLFLGSKYNPDSTTTFSLQYHLDHYQYDWMGNQRVTLQKSDVTKRFINQEGKDKQIDHHLTSFFKRTFREDRSLFVIFDYSDISEESISYIDERPVYAETFTESIVESESDGQVITLKSNYKTQLFDWVNTQLGIKLSQIKTSGVSVNKIGTRDKYLYEPYDIIDKIGASFVTLEKKYNKMTISSGVRLEYTKSNVHSNQQEVIDSCYFHLFPSAKFNYDLSDNLNLSLHYARNIDRPSFSELNPH